MKLLKDYILIIYLSVWNIGNNLIIWLEEFVIEDMVKECDKSIEEVKDLLIFGFIFVNDKVKIEIINVVIVMNCYVVSLNIGIVDLEEIFLKLMDDLKIVGWDKV